MGDPLGDRMKKYESVSSHKLTQKVPVILRVDGKAFHTFTRNATKPFDISLIESMVRSAEEVAKEMMGFLLSHIKFLLIVLLNMAGGIGLRTV